MCIPLVAWHAIMDIGVVPPQAVKGHHDECWEEVR